jgi:hypothetical protein
VRLGLSVFLIICLFQSEKKQEFVEETCSAAVKLNVLITDDCDHMVAKTAQRVSAMGSANKPGSLNDGAPNKQPLPPSPIRVFLVLHEFACAVRGAREGNNPAF